MKNCNWTFSSNTGIIFPWKEVKKMGRIAYVDTNIYPLPKGTSRLTNGYVYFNTSNIWKPGTDNSKGYSDHNKICIGKLIDPKDKKCNKLYANENYFKYVDRTDLPERRDRDDSISVGVYAAVQSVADSSSLIKYLSEVFSVEASRLILDLATYMISTESAVFQHYPHWGRSHETFSECIRSDSYISKFESGSITIPKINEFKNKWAVSCLKETFCHLFLCYDSTNVNSQAKGIYIVQKGHAKDDPDLDQINIDYVVRQHDGMPVTFKAFPGSIVDIAQAEEMIEFFGELIKESKETNDLKLLLTMICDRGYISEDNVKSFKEKGIEYLLMLRSDLKITRDILFEYNNIVESRRNYLEEFDQYAITVKRKLFDDDNTDHYFHVYWDSTLEKKNRNTLRNNIKNKEKSIKNAINRKTKFSSSEIKNLSRWFKLEVEMQDTIQAKKRGRGAKGETVDTDAYIITSYEEDYDKTDLEESLCGFFVLVTSQEMTCLQARRAYALRDCVEKTFQSLKSFMGMDKIGIYSCDEAVHTKIFIWFIASILHSIIFKKTSSLRTGNKKDYTLPAIIDTLEEIYADIDLKTKKYERRYALTKKQKAILKALNLSESDIDEIISNLSA